MNADVRFWQKVDKTDGCWLWTAGNKNGYGQFWFEGRDVQAHRAAYEFLVGTIPEGLTLDHLCRERSCVNPAHLEPVPLRENILRGTSPMAVNAAKTHCKNGHEFTPENTERHSGGGRQCVKCRRTSVLAYMWRRKVPCPDCRLNFIWPSSSRCQECHAAYKATPKT